MAGSPDLLMNREYHRWYSHRLGRDMELLAYGHAGPATLVFPTSMGRFYEFEDHGMVGCLSPHIESGNIRLVCVDSVDAESWYHWTAHPHGRLQRHLQYEGYLLEEVLPLTRSWNSGAPDQRIATLGCSLGAFHAALLALRHPHVVNRMLAISGKYDNTNFLDGYTDSSSYFTNPLAFIPGLFDESIMRSLRAMNIAIVTGSTDPHVGEARQLSHVLWEKHVPNTLDIWDGWMHDWPYWQAMVSKHL
jgi:esterase/lipase superfamily enzyme